MSNLPENGPFKEATEATTDDVVRQELITYRTRDGYLVRETTVRVFDSVDYIDNTTTAVLFKIQNVTMITVEHEFDHTLVTILDNSGECDDLELVMDDDSVYIVQRKEIIVITPFMLKELVSSYYLSEGSYITSDLGQ